ncbi:hypothetical protein H5410_051713 [Solanum commersonii]|uniref:Uncharacterized protein n=1 Tax=Solanum commersonii TaxID=4109 RepID=A0A9J5X1I9_SOLCO|nr:hypothetical protein H5410_051713 [Solanum commersonii]
MQNRGNKLLSRGSKVLRIMLGERRDPRLRPRIVSEEAYFARLRKRLNLQEPIGTRVISFRDDKSSVSEPTNLPVSPTHLAWKGKYAITITHLQAPRIQKLRPRMG